jgi:hypothetical protein
VIVELGTGYFCEKEANSAAELIDRKSQLIGKSMESIEQVKAFLFSYSEHFLTFLVTFRLPWRKGNPLSRSIKSCNGRFNNCKTNRNSNPNKKSGIITISSGFLNNLI